MSDKYLKPCPLYEYENDIQITKTMSFLEYYKKVSQCYGMSVPEDIEEILMVLVSLLMYAWQEVEE